MFHNHHCFAIYAQVMKGETTMNIPEETNTVIDAEQEQPQKKGWKRELL